MAELTPDDVSTYTGGRLAGGADPATTILLNAALAGARRYCGWAVSPVATVEVTVDGPGGQMLSLPTLNLLSVTAIEEDGVDIDPDDLRWSQQAGTVYKRGFRRCWTSQPGAITITMTHGFTEVEAADWRQAVLRLVNAMSYDVSDRTDPTLKRERVDNTDQEWYEQIITSDARIAMLFSQFRILPSP